MAKTIKIADVASSSVGTLESTQSPVKVFQRASEIKKVNLYEVKIDKSYQRDANRGHIGKIANKFNPLAPLYPALSRRKENGKWVWYIIDGQHLIQALKDQGYTHADCECFIDLTRKQEADIFYARSTGYRTIGGWVKFKSALASGQPNETDIMDIIHKAKLTTGLDVQNGDADVADFNTPRVLTEVYRKTLRPGFRRLINIMAKGWNVSAKDRHIQESARRTEIIRGLAKFLIDNGSQTDATFIAVLKANPASEVLDEAVVRAGRCHKQRSIERFVVEVLNEKLAKTLAKAAA